MMNSGSCHGGPYHGKQLHHHGEVFRVAVEPIGLHKLSAVPGLQSSTDPAIEFHSYRFADGVWAWQDDVTAEELHFGMAIRIAGERIPPEDFFRTDSE